MKRVEYLFTDKGQITLSVYSMIRFYPLTLARSVSAQYLHNYFAEYARATILHGTLHIDGTHTYKNIVCIIATSISRTRLPYFIGATDRATLSSATRCKIISASPRHAVDVSGSMTPSLICFNF